jgi:hypothetical protein
MTAAALTARSPAGTFPHRSIATLCRAAKRCKTDAAKQKLQNRSCKTDAAKQKPGQLN